MWISSLNSNFLLTYKAMGPPCKSLHCALVGLHSTHFVVVQSLSRVQFFETPWTATCQASLSFTIFWSLLKFMSIESVMPSNHLIHCHPLLLLPSTFPSIRVFSNDSALCIRCPKEWSFSLSICSSNNYSGLISFSMSNLISLQSKGLSRVFFSDL